jgi:hypothetical protein
MSNVLDVTSAPTALAPPDAGPQVAIFCDGSVRVASGGAEQAASFTIEDVASLNLPPGQGETSIKIDFDEQIPLTLAGASVSAEIKGAAVVSLKLGADDATAVVSYKFDDVASLKLDGATADGDLTVDFNGTGGIAVFGNPTRFPADLPSVGFDQAASLTRSQDGVASDSTGGGAGKVGFTDGWRSTVTGDAISINYTKRADLTVDDAPVLADMEKWDITPAAPAAGTTSPSSLMLDGMESLSLNFLTATMEYKYQWESVGDVTSLTWHDPLYMNFEGGSVTATQEGRLQMTGECSEVKYIEDVTLTPTDPTNLASSTQNIECADPRRITLTVDDTIDLMAAGLELTSHTRQTETGAVISIELNSLLSAPGPGPGG